MFPLEKKIYSLFGLYKGYRSKEDDEKIYHVLFDLCFEEVIEFIHDHLHEDQYLILQKELESLQAIDTSSIDVKGLAFEMILRTLSLIPQSTRLLNQRLEYLLENILYDTIIVSPYAGTH
jgi:hypothetical protein